MSRRGEAPLGALVAAGVLTLLSLWVARRGLDEWRANKILATVEWTSNQVATSGRRMPPQLLQTHLELLREAGEKVPADVAIQVARGSQFLLAGKLRAAARAYEDALALEPRAEIYLNLGRARVALGQSVEAEQALRTALALDPNLEPMVMQELGRLPRRSEVQKGMR